MLPIACARPARLSTAAALSARLVATLLASSACLLTRAQEPAFALREFAGLREVNPRPAPADTSVHAVVGGTLIDGRGGSPVADAVVLVRGNTIVAAGPRNAVAVPEGATVFDAAGMTILPGLVDCHFHMDRRHGTAMAKLWLTRGVTTLRDPGVPIRTYDPIRQDPEAPRLFLTGEHFDQAPPAHPHNAIIIDSADSANTAVERFLGQGASAIKVYFRLPTELIRATTAAAHANRIPVTAHLEIIDADAAIVAGIDGLEHITSLGTVLAEPDSAERFRAGVAANNAYRNDGRFRLWAEIDLERSTRVQRVVDLVVSRGIYVAPTLGIFERRPGDRNAETYHVRGFANMLAIVGRLHRAGGRIVNGSHTFHPHAKAGWGYQHEMELLARSGMSPVEVVTASTLRNAQFLGCAERLGSIEPGKLADVLIVRGDASKDIRALYDIRAVMLNGGWVTLTP